MRRRPGVGPGVADFSFRWSGWHHREGLSKPRRATSNSPEASPGCGDMTVRVCRRSIRRDRPAVTECSWTTECPDQPVLKMQYTTDQCVCLVDGVEMGTCTSEIVCRNMDLLEAKAADCCGF